MHLLCSPNFQCASYLDESTLRYEPIVKCFSKEKIQGSNLTFLSTSKVLLVRFFLLAKEGT